MRDARTPGPACMVEQVWNMSLAMRAAGRSVASTVEQRRQLTSGFASPSAALALLRIPHGPSEPR